MRPAQHIHCESFPCPSAIHDRYLVPEIEIDPETIRLILISECTPERREDYYYAGEGALFAQTTLQAFQDAGFPAGSHQELAEAGIYLTTAVKCGKSGYTIETGTIQNCSALLKEELALFPNVRAYCLMGDVAIKAFNQVVKSCGEGRVIPAGSTYKIRSGEFFFRGRRVFPSYLQAGPSFFIEKSKRRMIAQDLRAALELVNQDR
jgi:uracil-DNA glycosylase